MNRHPDAPDGPLADDEARQMLDLLHRYCEHDADLFDQWRIDSSRGPMYVTITDAPLPGVAADAYRVPDIG
ncbi:hypothetical protein ACFQVC_28545 [Streptomyces monticola]|uniref:Uncharacterized protein n=1 Tax=Streptomyces monticola TaxID=2666263 RepID=A0ABW2JPR2_9ACTN